MNVLYVSNTKQAGGAEIVLKRILRKIPLKNFTVFTPAGNFQKTLTKQGHKITICNNLQQLERAKNKLWFLSFIRRFFFVCLLMLRAIKREKIGLIDANNFASTIYSWLPAKVTRTPLVWHMHDIFARNSLEGKVCKFLGIVSSKIIAVSQAVKKSLIENGVRKEKIEVIYNGIDIYGQFNPQKYPFGSFRKELSIPMDVFLIGMLSLLVEWKGCHIFIDAINELEKNKISKENVKFIIAGSGWRNNEQTKYERELRGMIKKYQLEKKVIFTGKLSQEKVPLLLKDINIFAFNSIKPDSLPTVILEAMAMEKIVVASNVGGVPEMIEDNTNGYLVSPDNPEALAEKLLFCLANYPKLSEIQKEARQKISEYFNQEKQIRQLTNLYQSFSN